jgi:EpsI family protein
MIDRRDALIGLACAGALVAGTRLRPHRKLSLLANGTLDTAVPQHFGLWQSQVGGGLILPRIPGSLANRLYSETITRIYTHTGAGNHAIMLLIAYGSTQNDMLQLHRPENCYPALGFTIQHRHFADLTLATNMVLPAVALTATSSTRIEDILYWTRLGEFLPRTAGDQRMARFRTALRGYVADGVLVRATIIRAENVAPNFGLLSSFLVGLVTAMAPTQRRVLIGSERAGLPPV